jgi:hypothetical protein
MCVQCIAVDMEIIKDTFLHGKPLVKLVCYFATIMFVLQIMSMFTSAVIILPLHLLNLLAAFIAIFMGERLDRSPGICRCVAWLTRGTAVELYSATGKRYYTIVVASHYKKHSLVGHVCWFTRAGNIQLDPDGSVSSGNLARDIYAWLPLNKQARIEHILAWGPPPPWP